MASTATPPIRRREKRRHASSIDVRDPLYLLELAVRMDEACNLLEVPLEQGSLHHPQDFGRAMSFLEGRRGSFKPGVALTPIILSGLIVAREQGLRDAASDQESSTDQNWTASELVMACKSMRRQALQRARIRKRRGKLRIITMIAGICLATYAFFHHTMSRMERTMMELGYVVHDSSTGLEPCSRIKETAACRAVEANLWAYFRDYASLESAELRDCTRQRCSRDGRNIVQRQLGNIPGRASDLKQGPYAMHTVVSRDDTLWKDFQTSRDSWRTSEHDGRSKKGLEWLGDTTVNQLVREQLLKTMQSRKGSKFRVLDVGCGVGGTLYALAGAAGERWSDGADFSRLDYTGVSISSAEITNARRLATEHEMDPDKVHFEQMSFDSAELRNLGKFASAVAIESLSFSQDIKITLSNLASVIQSGGLLIVVDDVIRSAETRSIDNKTDVDMLSHASARPSLLTHSDWISALKASGFTITEAVDLGLEYDLPQMTEKKRPSISSTGLSWLLHFTGWNRRSEMFLKVMRRWEAWTRAGISDDTDLQNEADIRGQSRLRTLQLMQDNIHFLTSWDMRKELHQRVDLTYNMYVCTKR